MLRSKLGISHKNVDKQPNPGSDTVLVSSENARARVAGALRKERFVVHVARLNTPST